MKVLKIILNMIRWIIGVTLIFASFGGIIGGDYINALIIMIIGVLCLPIVTNKLFNKNPESSDEFLAFLQSFGTSNKIINSLNFDDKENLIAKVNQEIAKSSKPINDKKKYNIGKEIYKRALQNTLLDLHISEKEISHLEDIVSNFNLNLIDVSNIRKLFCDKAVESLIKKSYDDKILTDEEKSEIFILAEYLNMPKEKVESIRLNVAASLLKTALNEKLSDKRLSPTEETELNEILKNLKIEKDQISTIFPKKSLDELAYAKLLWNLNNGIFTIIPNPPITLRNSEECYFALEAKLLERKTVNKGYSHRTRSISVPVFKDMEYNVSYGRSVPIEEEITITHRGTIYLTNFRIVFLSGSKNFEILFSELLKFNVFSDGIEFILNNENFLMKINEKELELFVMGMSSAIRNFFDENELKNSAMKEIENNETFIGL
ncbi:hypothetical protein FLAT13_03925 [Flavobacterium salmonis]|uniref:Uncharacterized protein n=1 Tax=Flavobacterium salmonis TaxID=2654844 RepID=A0A6V6Z9M1_9FLAO|nr:hypothetical protein FLAT13_03925 [Flavobacterium salmonis]